ncbi:MAG: SIS domain-containing protein [Chthonomonadaceae bacterium]|nr:SIS domain-containing protein [Chthonomonadaceae bacterium]
MADTDLHERLGSLASLLAKTFRSGGQVLVCGNGGSCADATHFAEEWTGRFHKDRHPYPVMAINDGAHITCTANDYGFDQIFARTVSAFARENDLLFVLSTSGNSQNLILAAQAAHSNRAQVVGFLGRGGGNLAAECDWVWVAPGKTADRIQELHMLALHALIQVTEEVLCG